WSRGEEASGVEGLLLAEQVVDAAAQPRGERPQGAGLAVLLLPAGEPALGLVALAEEPAGSLGEGPFEVGVADLVAAAALLLPGRLVGAAHQPGVGEELAGGGESADVVDLIKQYQRQHLADARGRPQAVEGLRVVHLRGPAQVQLRRADLLVVGVDQRQVGLGAAAGARGGGAARHRPLLPGCGRGAPPGPTPPGLP